MNGNLNGTLFLLFLPFFLVYWIPLVETWPGCPHFCPTGLTSHSLGLTYWRTTSTTTRRGSRRPTGSLRSTTLWVSRWRTRTTWSSADTPPSISRLVTWWKSLPTSFPASASFSSPLHILILRWRFEDLKRYENKTWFQRNLELNIDQSYRHRPLNFYLEHFYFPHLPVSHRT